MRFYIFSAAFALTSALGCAARAADAPDNLAPSAPEARALLWKNAPLGAARKPAATQKQFADAASGELSLLSELRAWRDTLDGRGKFARRDVVGDKKAGLSLGNVAAPTLGGFNGGAGIAAHWGAVEIGSTLRPRELDAALLDFDQAMTGEKKKPAAGQGAAQSVTWLRAQPIQSKNGALELTMARAARDVAPGADGKTRAGTFMGASGNLSLPLKWKLNGNWQNARLDEGAGKTSWNAKMGGPIAHPFGEARAELEWRETGAGYATLTGQDANGGSGGGARLTQDIKMDRLSGQLRLAANARARRNLEAARQGDALENRDANGAAELRLKLTPNLSLKASGALGAAEVVRAGDDFAAVLQAAPDATDEATFREETQTQGGDVGVEWKLNQALSVAATVGNSQTAAWRDDPTTDWTPTAQSQENRVGFELKHQTGAGILAAKYATRERDDASLGAWRRLETVGLQAERPLLFGLKLRASVDLARDAQAAWGDEHGVARRAEAQLQLSRRSRFDLNYRDGAALPGAWLSDPLAAPFRPTSAAQFSSGDRQWAARFNAGSAAGGNGLGLAFEYARQQQSSGDTDQWRVGLTWK